METNRAPNAAMAQAWPILVGASLMLSLSMGMRQTVGLLMGPITKDLAISTADFTFAVAVQNMAWGLSQPFVAAAADRWGLRRIAMAGALLFGTGLGLAVFAPGGTSLVLGVGVLVGLGLSCNGSSLAMSAAARPVSESSRSTVLGIVSAAGSVGTLLIAPLVQAINAAQGWRMALAMFMGLSVLILPAAFCAGGVDRLPRRASARDTTLGQTLRLAARDRGYVVMSGAFFVCGLQLVFLTTHLPTYLNLCGMDPVLGAEALSVIGGCNVVGSYLFGWLGGRLPKHVLLGSAYLLRSLSIAAFFILPVSPTSTLLFAASMGLLWLGVVPLVNGLIAEAFGLRFMATLAGVAFLSHQVGSFIGAYAGGLIYDALGSYDRAWQAAVAIGLVAGALQITAGRPGRRPGQPESRPGAMAGAPAQG